MVYLLDSDRSHFAYPDRPTYSDRGLLCSLCQDDETVSEERKAHDYSDRWFLAEHMASKFHTLMFKFKRAAEIRFQQDGDYICPYPECGKGFSYVNGLVQHIIGALERPCRDGRMELGPHVDAIRAAGWASPEFKEKPSRGKKEFAQSSKKTPASRKAPKLWNMKRQALSDDEVGLRTVKIKMPRYEASIMLGAYPVPETFLERWVDAQPSSAESTGLSLEGYLDSKPDREALVSWELQPFDVYMAQNPQLESVWTETELFSWDVDMEQFGRSLHHEE